MLAAIALRIAPCLAAVPGDERWGREFYAPNFVDAQSVAIDFTTNGHLVYGGVFSGVAGVPDTRNLACWDGTNWMSIGGGVPSGSVRAVLVVGNDLYVGGIFTSLQGQNITNLARWDGTNWHAVGNGVTGGSVRALAWHDGALYVGGLFTNAGGTYVRYLASWDGASWNALGGGIEASNPSTAAPPVASLLSFNGALYVGGYFFGVGGVQATNIARWNGAAWESLGVGANNGVSANAAALAGGSNGVLYVGGGFTHAGTNLVNGIAAWDGQGWSGLDGGVSDPVPFAAGVGGLLTVGSNLWACGNFTKAGTNAAFGIARWDGVGWSGPILPARHPLWRIAAHGSRMVVSGRLWSLMRGTSELGLFQYDGEEWSIIGAGMTGGGLRTVSMADGKLQVSGHFGASLGNGLGVMVAEWNGRGWTNLGDGLLTPYGDPYTYVQDFLYRDGVMYAAGRFLGYVDGVYALSNGLWMSLNAPLTGFGQALAFFRGELFVGEAGGIWRRSAAGWTNVGDGLSGSVRALCVMGDDLYAGGSFAASGATPMSNIARWNGTNWSALGAGVNGPVAKLGSRRDELYVAGSFSEAGGISAVSVARWCGGAWSALGAGLSGGSGTVNGLSVMSDGRVFATGTFMQSGATTLNYIAQWDGTNWGPLGSGLNAPGTSLATDETDLFIGGGFNRAGGIHSLGIARWRLHQNLNLSGLALTNVGQVTLTVRGEPGTRFAVEASPDLQEWTSVSTNDLLPNPVRLVTGTNGAKHFYRVRQVP